jgi:hypothetical protein
MNPQRKAVRSPGGRGPARKAVVKTTDPPLSKEVMTRKLLAFEATRLRLMAERDELVRQGWDAGISVDVMAACLGITPARIYQIKDGL